MSAETLGPVTHEVIDNYPDSLVALGFVYVNQVSPTETLFALTTKGANSADMYSYRRRNANGNKVPPSILDRTVKSVRNLKPYGLELFTDDDIKEIREKLPEDFHNVPIAGLRQQIVNRRKVGAFKTIEKLPEWYTEYRNTKEFREVAAKLLDSLSGRCSLNHEHILPESGESIEHVYHRRLSDDSGRVNIGRELMKDLLILCPQCYNRQRKFMCEIPSDDPR